MQKTARGTGDDQIYTNMTIILKTAEPSFGATLRKVGKIQMDTPKTVDGGKTWKVDKIVLGAMLPGTAFKPSNRPT
jgi:hypothetical protein